MLWRKYLVGFVSGVLLWALTLSAAHAAHFGEAPHEHDGIACTLQAVTHQEDGLALPPAPPTLQLPPAEPVVRPVANRVEPVSARKLPAQARGPPLPAGI